MIFKCLCDYCTNSSTVISLHRVSCLEYQNQLKKKLTKDFFIENIERKKFTLYYITTKILNSVFSYNAVINEAVKYGYSPLSPSEAAKRGTKIREQTNLERYGKASGVGRKTFSIKNNGNPEIVSLDYISNVLNKDFFDLHIKNNKLDCVDITTKILNNKFSYPTVLSYAKKYGYLPQNKSDAVINSRCKQEKTMESLYGVKNCSQSSIIKNKKIETNQKNRGTDYPMQSKEVFEKGIHTNLRKRGVKNVSQSSEIKNKKEETFFKNFNVKNIFCITEYIQKCFFNIYGVNNPSQVKEFQEKKQKSLMLHYGITNPGVLAKVIKCSKSSQKFFELLYNRIPEEIKKYVYFGDLNEEFKIKCESYNYFLDFSIVCDTFKVCIEYNGDMWHANPKLFKAEDFPDPFHPKLTAREIWDKDKKRLNDIESKNFNLFVVWESDINKDVMFHVDKCLGFIMENMGKIQQ